MEMKLAFLESQSIYHEVEFYLLALQVINHRPKL